MQTEIVSADSKFVLKRAIDLLRAGEIVALPTETVYGLAADAVNPVAVAKIFEAKQRPRFDPLITHLPGRGWLREVVREVPEIAAQLIQRFWPGPLTIVLQKQPLIPDIVTAGLDTVAVRMSADPLFAQVAQQLARPIAAPSANRFGRVSATAAEHVFDELGGRIPLIIDGGPTIHGLESTIIRVVDGTIEILRRGPITAEMLEEIAPVSEVERHDTIVAPGQLSSHYAPQTRLMVVESWDAFRTPREKRIGALRFGRASADSRISVERQLSEREDLREAAVNLFSMLRELDNESLDLIVARVLPEKGLGAAINERLRRASTPA